MTSNIGHSALDRLKNLAKKDGAPVSGLIDQYCFTSFLRRLSTSRYKDFFVLKGALMLLILTGEATRPTKDVDLDGKITLSNEELLSAINEILSEPTDDGVEFLTDTLKTSKERNNDSEGCGGAKISCVARVGKAKVMVKIDIGYENPITPKHVEVSMPTQIKNESGFKIFMYPPETAIAEKIAVMAEQKENNSRIKDLWDIRKLSGTKNFHLDILAEAIHQTCLSRNCTFKSIDDLAVFDESNRQNFAASYHSFIKKNGITEAQVFQDCADWVKDFITPAIQVNNGDITNDQSYTWCPKNGWNQISLENQLHCTALNPGFR